MNTLNFLKKAFVLSRGNPQKYKPELWGAINQAGAFRSVMNLASSLIGVAGQVPDNSSDANALARNLNDRFGRVGLYIIDADSRNFVDTFSRLHRLHAYDGTLIQKDRERLEALSEQGLKNDVSSGIKRFMSSLADSGVKLYETARVYSHLKSMDRNVFTNDPTGSDHVSAVVDLGRIAGTQPESQGNGFLNASLDNQKWFSVFGQELGRAVQPLGDARSYVELMDVKGTAIGEKWLQGCYSDVFSACLSARATGNWDTVRLVMLPAVAMGGAEHDTFCILKNLTKMDIGEINSVSDQQLARHVHWITLSLIDKAANNDLLHNSARATGEMTRFFSGQSNEVDASDPAVNKHLYERSQVVVDALVVDTLVTNRLDAKGVNRLGEWFEALGFQDVSHNIKSVANLPASEAATRLAFFADKGVESLADRVNTNEFSIGDYIDDLKSPEMGYFITPIQDPFSPLKRESPAMGGADL